MSLQFIIGGSGSGKTEWIYNHLLTLAEADKRKNFYMIVPEQFTMQTQKALVERSKNHAILNIDVVSFDRLAYRIFDELGKTDMVVLGDTGKNLILRKLAEDCKDQLKTLKHQIHKISYIDQIKSLISEFMQYGLEPEDLERYLENLEPNSALYYKLNDMLLLYKAFDRYLKEGFVTSERILDVLADSVSESKLLANAVVAFDGFTGFTPVQMKLVRQLLKVADASYMSVTMDPDVELYADKGIQDLFYMSRKMLRSVVSMAKAAGCAIEEPIFIHGGCEEKAGQEVSGDKVSLQGRFCNNPVLAHLEEYLFRPGQHVFEHSSLKVSVNGGTQNEDGISIYSLATPKDELLFAASQIRKLIKEHGYRYGDFAIVSGNVAGYEKYAKEVFELYEIPFFADVKETIYYHPFTEWVRALIEMIETGLTYDGVFRYLRCGLCGFSMEEIDILDNYVLERGIRGYKKWNEKWVHPFKQIGRGIKKSEEEQMASLLQLNELRQRFVSQITPVYSLLKKGTVCVADMTKAIYEVMVALDIQKQLEEKKEIYEAAGEEYLAATYGQIYRIVIDLMDQVVDLLGDEVMPIREYAQVLDAGFVAAKVGTIPPGADCVIVGDIERTRLDHIKVLFFIGVNDGIVPKTTDRKNLLSQYDRELLEKDQIELAPTMREQVFLQKFYLYLNMTKPQDCLIMTYARMDSMGSAVKPSYLINTMQQLFSHLVIHEIETDFAEDTMSAKSSTKQYLYGLSKAVEGHISKEFKALHQWRMAQPAYHEATMRLLNAAFAVFDGEELTPELAKCLYGNTLYNSVTRLEQFFSCAYAHFLQYGLKLSKRPEYRFESADMGTIFHDAIASYCDKMREQTLDWFTITENEQERLLTEAVSETLLAMDTGILQDSARNQYITTRITNILGRSVWALTRQIRKGEFAPVGYEQPFFQELAIGADSQMVVTGRIDRIDTYENDKQLYVKIMDYKSGKKDFNLNNILQGQDLQLAVYMHSALEKFKKEFPDRDVIPAGMLYYHLDDPSIDGDGKLSGDLIEQKIFEKCKPTGLVNQDSYVVRKLDVDVSAYSDVIPVYVDKEGMVSEGRSSSATREQFTILDTFVKNKMKQAGEAIMEGQIEPQPLLTDKKDGCEWCPYQDICGFDLRIPGYKRNQPEKITDKGQIWVKMEEEIE